MAIIVDNFSGTPLEGKGETILLDYGSRTDGQPVFVGYLPPGKTAADAAAKIMKLTYDGSNNLTSRLWALTNGNAEFANVWNDRAGLAYG